MIDSNTAAASPILINPNITINFGGFGNLQDSLGIQQASDAVGNLLGTGFGEAVKRVIEDSPLPEFMKDNASEAIDTAMAESIRPVPPQAEADAKEQMQEVIDQMMEDAFHEMNETTQSTGEGNTANNNGGENWLAALAKALGAIAGRHLENSVELGKEITALSNGETGPGEMAELTAEMQAETQMFKMAQEAATTIVKSVGEALQTTARKQ